MLFASRNLKSDVNGDKQLQGFTAYTTNRVLRIFAA